MSCKHDWSAWQRIVHWARSMYPETLIRWCNKCGKQETSK